MAGTVLLPVRGRQRIAVVAALTLSGVVTGALVGGIAGAALGLVPEPGRGVLVGIVVSAAVLDAVPRSGLRPLDLRRQVPLAWGRLFTPVVSAGLYGSRLGVGPATILTSWTWWAAAVVAGLQGPVVGAAVGAAFHLARVITMLVATSGGAGPDRMAMLDRLDRPARLFTVVAAVFTAAALGW